MQDKLDVSIAELTTKFGPAINVSPWGECLVISSKEFLNGWETDLANLGYRCHFGSLDSRQVAYVQLKKNVAEGKVVYVPDSKPTAARIPEASMEVSKGNFVEVKETDKSETENKESKQKKPYNLRGPSWSPAEDAALMKAYDAFVTEKGTAYGSNKVLAALPELKNRSPSAIGQRVDRIVKKRTKQAPKKQKEAERPPKDSIEVQLAIQGLSEAYDALSKVYVEVKTNLDQLREYVEANLTVKDTLEKLERNLRNHQHAKITGKALVPMEASA